THTQRVVKSLGELAGWEKLSLTEKNILILAALLHDIAKPITFKLDEQGRPCFSDHSTKGYWKGREILMQTFTPPVPFFHREVIVSLIRFHRLPLKTDDNNKVEKLIYMASQTTPLYLLALLAEADVMGRISPDKQNLLDRVKLFRDFAKEKECFRQPKSFFNDHTRVLYFQNQDLDPQAEIKDNTKTEVIMMAGLPGSGKDYWIKKNMPSLPVISLDQIREEIQHPPSGDQSKVITLAKDRAKDYLRKEQPFIWNATSLKYHLRQPLIQLFTSYQARCRIVYRETLFSQILKQNQSRSRVVPPAVIYEMASEIDMPDLTEAHEVVYSIY
ncbi:MAG: HD domain-containing protein, partial [Planctomycetota bacterium]